MNEPVSNYDYGESTATKSVHAADGSLEASLVDNTVKCGEEFGSGNIFGEGLKSAMRRVWTEKELIDVKQENGMLKAKIIELHTELAEALYHNSELETEVNEFQKNAESHATTNVENARLQSHRDQLIHAIQEKELEIAMYNLSLTNAEEVKHTNEKRHQGLIRLQSEHEVLRNKYQELVNDFNIAKSDSTQLREKNNEQSRKILELMDKISQLEGICQGPRPVNNPSIDLSAHIETMMANLNLLIQQKAQDTEEIRELKAELQSLQSEYGTLKDVIAQTTESNMALVTKAQSLERWNAGQESENASLQTELNTLRTANAKLTAKKNQIQARASKDSSLNHQLQSQNTALRSENEDLDYEIRRMLADIAYYITQLDLAYAGYRVFDCVHDQLSDIPDRKNSTKQNSIDHVVMQLYRDYAKNTTFLKRYTEARQDVLDHHRAHERARQGRGSRSYDIRDECTYHILFSLQSLIPYSHEGRRGLSQQIHQV